MRNKIKNSLKLAIILSIILLLSLFTYAKITKQTVWAATQSAAQATQQSIQEAVTAVKEWAEKVNSEGKVVIKNPSAATLSSLVDPSQVRDDGIYITHENLINIPSLFCSGKGVALPGYNDTVVRSGGRETTTTDQGKETAYLTTNDIPTATVFRNLNEWTGYGATYTTKYEDTISKTYGKFKLVETRNATPAEAWVLAEMDKNVPGSIAKFERTDNEYTGEVKKQTVAAVEQSLSSFLDNIRSIAKYAKSNNYEYGNLEEIPVDADTTKKINDIDAIKWALYSIGYDVGTMSIEEFCQLQNWEKIEDYKKVQAGDIIFSKNDNIIRIFAASNKVYDFGSAENIQQSQPIKYTLSAENFNYAYRISTGVKETRKTVATLENSKSVVVDGVTLYLVGNTGEEQYVEERNGKYYYVNVSDGYAPYTYVQHAWWKVKTVGYDGNRSGIKDTGLAREAEAFEAYVKEVNGKTDVSQLERNEDGTFKIDYKVSMEPEDTSKVDTRFNQVTNKYIVGPFKVNYLRAVTQQDDPILGPRPKVSFSGIAGSILVGVDAQGNELVDSEGNSLLQLGKNYRFVYSNTDDPNTNFGHDTARNALDTDLDYPYPSSGEEFYIEIDYIDDLAAIKNFKFDFQYMTAGGQYEYYTGDYLEIHWTQVASTKTRTVRTGTVSNIDNAGLVANISSRSSTSGGETGATFELSEDTLKVEHLYGSNLGGNSICDVKYDSIDSDPDKIYYHGRIALGWFGQLRVNDDDIKIESVSVEEGTAKKTGDNKNFDLTFNRDWTKPMASESHKLTLDYKCTKDPEKDYGQAPDSGSVTEYVSIEYSNKLLGNTAKVSECGDRVKIVGNDVFVIGDITIAEAQIDFDVEWLHEETKAVEDEILYWYVVGDSLSVVDEKKGIFKVEKTGETLICVATVAENGWYIEEKSFMVNVPDFCYDAETEKTSDTVHVNTSKVYYNAMGSVEEVSNSFENRTNHTLASPLEVVADNSFGQINTHLAFEDPYSAYMEAGYEYEPITFTFKDEEEKEITLTVEWDPETPTGEQVIDDTEESDGSNQEDEGTNGSNQGNGETSGSNQGNEGTSGNNQGNGETSGSNQGNEETSGSNQGNGETSGSNQGNEETSGSNQGNEETSGSNQGNEETSGSNQGNGEASGSNQGNEGTSGSNQGNEGTSGNPSTVISAPAIPVTVQYSYCYYMRATSATIKIAQDQINASGSHEVIDVNAQNGLGVTAAGIPVELEMIRTPIDLRTSLSGVVWIDQDEQKEANSGTLGIYDSSESPARANSVEVVVWKVTYEIGSNTLKEVEREKAIAWDENKNVIDFINTRIYVNDKGEYNIPEIQVPSKEGLDTSKYIISYDVEFVYDGQTYEATEYLKSTNKDTVAEKLDEFKKTADETKGAEKDYTAYAKDSYIVENAAERKEFDSYFTEVYGKDAVNVESKTTNGLSTGGNAGSYYLAGEVYDDNTNKELSTELTYKSEVNESSTGYKQMKSDLITTNADGYVLDQYKFAARTSEAGLLLPYERLYHVEEDYYDNLMFQTNAYKPVDEYFEQINLGLLERYETDLSLVKDLYSAKVIVNKQQQQYTFNQYAGITEEMLTQQIDANSREKTYKLDLYASDYYYRSSVYNTVQDEITRTVLTSMKDETELRMFVTYRIEIFNESVKTDVSVNEFKDYYDKTFTLVTGDVTANVLDNNEDLHDEVVAVGPYYRKLSNVNSGIEGLYNYNKAEDLAAEGIDAKVSNPAEKVVGEVTFTTDNKQMTENEGYKESSTMSLAGLNPDGSINHDMTLEPGEGFEIFVTYEVDYEGFQEAQKQNYQDGNERPSLLNSKYNIAEISNYTTVYTAEGVERHKTTRYNAGQISGRIDRDSAPDNINIKDTNPDNFEDDTKAAPTLNIELKYATPRTLDGVVWEDSRGENEEADGIYNPENESGIQNVDVTMVEKIRITSDDLSSITKEDGTIVDLNMLDYEFEFVWPDGAYGPEVPFTARTKTNDKGEYQFSNFTSGNYVIRFEYGNSEETLKYNGQDYKNTAYQTGMTNAQVSTDGTVTTGTSNEAGKYTLNNEWHDLSNNENAKALESARVSDARDYEPRRLKVMAYSRTITNENAEVLAAYINDQSAGKVTDEYKAILEANKQELIKNTAMVANTAKINVEIEKQSDIAYKTVETTEGTTEHEYKITNIDFGLVKRPETRLNIKKEISQIILTKNDGQDVVLRISCDENGNIIKDGEGAVSGKSVSIQKITEIEKPLLALGSQGFKYIAVEASFLNGLDIYLKYNITVLNDSETDYVGEQIAAVKNVQDFYDMVTYYETRESKDGENYGQVPFNTGKGIVYGKYLGLHYYTNSKDAVINTEDIENKEKMNEMRQKLLADYGYSGYTDKVVTTTVDQVVDYVDNDISINKDETENVENQSWVVSTAEDRLNKFSSVSYLENTQEDSKLTDDKGRAYVSDTTSKNNVMLTQNENIELGTVTYTKTAVNEDGLPVMTAENGILVPQIEEVQRENVYTVKRQLQSSTLSTYNPKLTKELKPGETCEIAIVTSTHASQENINNMNYDNLAEILMYSNTVGRRDMQAIPGNANLIAKELPAYKAGYQVDYQAKAAAGATTDKGYFAEQSVEVTDGENKKTITTERDAYAARDTITFSEPTGLSIERQTINKVIRIILTFLIIAAVAVIAATVIIVMKKTKYDDSELLKTNEKN